VSYVDPLNARCIALMERVGARLDTDAMEGLEATLVYRHEKGGMA
jgi:RimJ/RimL family protein N-acetyltransferase